MNSDSIPPLIEKNWQSITSHTLWRISSLLDAVRILLKDVDDGEEQDLGKFTMTIGTGDPTIAAGLYTFAIEEYGKYLYLKSLEPVDGKYHIDYLGEFKNHPKKFERALSNLPDECKLVHLGEKEDTEFYEPDFHKDIIADFETRLRIFYSDFDPLFANKISKYEPPVSVKLLKNGVQKLWDIVELEHECLMKIKNDSTK